MDLDYYIKLQNAYGVNSKREKNLLKINSQMSNHFYDTFSPETVLVNGRKIDMMIIKDTDGNTYKRKFKTKHNDYINLGEYVYWNNQYWLITFLDVDDKTWHRGYIYLCTVPLRWQDDTGKTIEKWAFSEDFTKYSKGTYGNTTIITGDNQYGLTVGVDDDTKRLHRDMRFAIDFEGVAEPDVYKLTNRKMALENYEYFNRGATMILTLSYDAFNKNTDKLVELDNNRIWICDYNSTTTPPSPPSEENLGKVVISFNGKPELKIGGNYKTFTAMLDKNGELTQSVSGTWEIISIPEMTPFINYTTSNNVLRIKIDNDEFAIGNKIRLKFTENNTMASTYLDVNVVNSF